MRRFRRLARPRASISRLLVPLLMLPLPALLLACCLPAIASQAREQQVASSFGASELSFEHSALESIASVDLCRKGHAQAVNSVSFAFNRIESVGSNAFDCVARHLRILNLRRNRISSIAPDAFVRLAQLQVLLLDGNRLRRVPSRPIAPLVSLRHLNLAFNQIEAIGSISGAGGGGAPSAPDDQDQLRCAHLVSLNLRANPLESIAPGAFKQLVRLKTLVLSETRLTPAANSTQLAPFEGLGELRFLHLDHLVASAGAADDEATARVSLARDFCSHSQRLTSLVLRANQLVEIPQFSNCQNLLQLDLAFNRIAGALNGHFRAQANLIDLYLSSNRIEVLDEAAFAGLGRLQVLDLQRNQLKFIHSRAFVPLGASLLELNVAQNGQLEALPALGLERQLRHLRAFGNYNLRQLPRLEAVETLALTYAYHCCDYLAASSAAAAATAADSTLAEDLADFRSVDAVADPNGGASAHGDILLQIRQFFNYFTAATRGERASAGHRRVISLQTGDDNDNADDDDDDAYLRRSADLRNLSESVVWRSAAELASREGPRPSATRPPPDANPIKFWRAPRAALPARPNLAQPEDGSGEVMGARGLIDELVARLAGIRRRHSNEQLAAGDYSDEEDAAVGVGPLLELPLADDHEAELLDETFVSRQVAVRLAQLHRRNRRHRRHPQQQLLLSKRHAQPGTNETRATGPWCQPQPNAFQPCRDLFDQWWLRLSVWLVALSAFLGNILVIVVLSSVRASSSSALSSIMWSQAHSKRHIDVPRFLVINLAVADLMMACYLGVLACVDLATWSQFKYFALRWQYSSGCRAAGFLAVLSSELSVFILAIITLERNYAITNAVHLNRRLSLQKAMLIMLLGYSFALVMAALPLNGVSDYRRSSTCLPGLDFASNLSSQVYLIALISINTGSFLLLLGCYLRMYCAIRGSQAWNTNDLRIAKRMSVLVLTDFLCWMPIILVSVSSLFGHHLVGSSGLKVLTVFVLPLNSVANPFLYAITTKKFKRDLATLRRRFGALLVACCCCCCFRTGGKRNSSASNEANYNDTRWHLNADNKLLFGKKYQGALVAGGVAATRGGHNKRRKEARQPLSSELLGVNHPRAAGGVNRLRSRQDKAATSNSRRRFKFEQSDAYDDDECQRRFNTFNQVTINRTTCSCGARNARPPSSAALESQAPGGRRQVAVQVRLDGSSQLAEAHLAHQPRPRIVLDVAVEPTLDVALVPLGLSCCELTSAWRRTQPSVSKTPRDPASADLSLDLSLGGNHNNSPAIDTGGERPTGGCCDSSTRTTSERLAPTKTSLEHPHQPTQQPAADEQLRAHSANSTQGPPAGGLVSLPAGSLHQHVSCQAILVSSESATAGSNVGNIGNKSADQSATRSASACGHSGAASQVGPHYLRQPASLVAWSAAASMNCGLAGAQHTCCSTPADEPLANNHCRPGSRHSPTTTSGGGGGAGDRSSWRSINRLIFSPLIKTWSSIQLSLQAASQQHSAPRADDGPERKAPTSSADREHDQPTSSSLVNADEDLDILQLSSPARRRLLRNSERRMSRSCELIANKHNKFAADSADDAANAQSSFAINEPSSSQYDQSDDQRILLATINRMAGDGQRALVGFSNQNAGQQLAPTRRCKRCRSWSPALLDKLEDCMYQIKSRIPTFHFGTARHESVFHEQMEQSEFSESSTNPLEDLEAHKGTRTTDGPMETLIDVDHSCSSASSCNDNAAIEHDNELGDKLGSMQKARPQRDKIRQVLSDGQSSQASGASKRAGRPSRRRLRQQLSGNSDTLSIRTAGTMVTSVLSDSNWSIPAAHLSEADRDPGPTEMKPVDANDATDEREAGG